MAVPPQTRVYTHDREAGSISADKRVATQFYAILHRSIDISGRLPDWRRIHG
jgi:hypothetical protein